MAVSKEISVLKEGCSKNNNNVFSNKLLEYFLGLSLIFMPNLINSNISFLLKSLILNKCFIISPLGIL